MKPEETRSYKIIYSPLGVWSRGTSTVPRGRIKVAETVHVRISAGDSGLSQLDVALVERARTELAGRAAVRSIEEVQQAAAVIPGNWSDDIIAERGEY